MAQVAALILLLLGLLPIANWIPGGHQAPWYGELLRLWGSGGAIVLGVAVIATIVARRYPDRWPRDRWGWLAMRWRGAGRSGDGLIALSAGAVYAAISQLVFGGRPSVIDEIIQVYQARIFASGRLWAVAPSHPEFTSTLFLLDWNGKVYGQFPAGGSAMLAIGTLLHAEWLVGPVAAAIGVYAFARLLRLIESRDSVALAALLLLAFAPFCAFFDASMMNHVTETTWLLLASLALAFATAPAAGAAPRAAFLMGLCLGIAASIRPLDAASFAIPAAGWLIWRALRGGAPHLWALLWSGVGIAIPIALLLLVNKSQTGHPLEFGYTAMWGKAVELGFHAAPWGFPHTPARGLELVNIYLLRLQSYFLETPVPSLLFATGALALTRRLTAFDRWALIGSGLLLLCYFAYWHDGFYLGPRFMLSLTPWLALWTARFPATLGEWNVPIPVRRGVVVGAITALGMAATMLVPIRANEYRHSMAAMRFDVDALARKAGVRGALVFVRESWGGQLIARMWALGVTRIESEKIYHTTDACQLDDALAAVEGAGGKAADLIRRVAPLRADSFHLTSVHLSPDTSLHIRAGAKVGGRCLRRIIEDRNGFTIFSPLVLARGEGNVYLRDLHASDSLAIKAYPGRPIFLFTKDTLASSIPRFVPLSLDSMRTSWQADQEGPP